MDKHTYCGIFYNNEEDKKLPQIFIAAKLKKTAELPDLFFIICHELTHYFQWYFYEDEKKSERSLEIMATKWGTYIVCQYLDQIEESSIT